MKPREIPDAAAQWAVHDLVEIALTTPRSVADIFINWSPHCDVVSVTVFDGGWEDDKPHDLRIDGYVAGWGAEHEPVAKAVANLRQYLAGISSKPEPDPLGLLAFARAERSAA